MSKKSMSIKTVSILLVLVLLMGLAVGGTVAWLIDGTETVVNTFTYGDINITLTESDTGLDDSRNDNTNEYQMIPGKPLEKDPVVTVQANSEKSWLFVKMEKLGGAQIFDEQGTLTASYSFDDYLEYEMDKVDGSDPAVDVWTALTGVEGVYYRVVEKSDAEQKFSVINEDKVFVKDTVTKEMVNALDAKGTAAEEDRTYPQLKITAYAVQYTAAADAAAAWALAEAEAK